MSRGARVNPGAHYRRRDRGKDAWVAVFQVRPPSLFCCEICGKRVSRDARVLEERPTGLGCKRFTYAWCLNCWDWAHPICPPAAASNGSSTLTMFDSLPPSFEKGEMMFEERNSWPG